MRSWIRVGALVLAVFLLLARTANAYLSAHETRTITSANGKYLLVLLTPKD